MRNSREKRSVSTFDKYTKTSNEIKDKLLQDSLTFKTQLNKFKEEAFLQRKANEELAKENRDLNAIAAQLLSNSNLSIDKPKLHHKLNEAFLVIELKKEIRALALKLKLQQNTIDEYKKNIKLTKKNEFSLENEVILQEMAKLKSLYLQAKVELDNNKSQADEVLTLKSELLKRNFIVLSLNDKVNLYLKELKDKSEAIEMLIKKLNEKEMWYKNALIKLKYQKQVNNELMRDSSCVTCIKGEPNGKLRLIKSNKDLVLIKRPLRINSNSPFMPMRTEDNLSKGKMNRTYSSIKDKMNQSKRSTEVIDAISDSNYKEISYILMKAIEGKGFTVGQIEMMFESKDIKTALARKSITQLSNCFVKEICSLLLIQEQSEVNDVSSFVKRFLKKSNAKDLSAPSFLKDLKKEFIELFTSIAADKSLANEDEVSKGLSLVLTRNKELLLKEFASKDIDKTGCITFKDLKTIIRDSHVDLSGELLEYAIYQMKVGSACSLDHLDYSTLMKKFIEKEEKSDIEDKLYEECEEIIEDARNQKLKAE